MYNIKTALHNTTIISNKTLRSKELRKTLQLTTDNHMPANLHLQDEQSSSLLPQI